MASLDASPRLFQKLFLVPLRGLLSSIAQLPGYVLLVLSSCGPQIIFIYSRLSSASLTEFVQEQRRNVTLPGEKYLWMFYLPIYLLIVNPFLLLVGSLENILETSVTWGDPSHVPTFYAPDSHVDSDDALVLYAFVLPLVATIFGAMHLIAWRFHFPSHVEQLLWRIGSVAITALPSVVLACALSFAAVVYIRSMLEETFDIQLDLNFHIPMSLKVAVNFIGAWLAGAGLVGYMVARLLLITEAVILLRNQPKSAFYAINWSRFMLHI